MNIKLLAVDLDGTLLKNNKSIDADTQAFLISFQENGGILTLISGRRINEMEQYICLLAMQEFKKGYVISCDGQYIWDLGKNNVIRNEFLDIKDLLYLLSIMDMKRFRVSFYDENFDYVLLNDIFAISVRYIYNKIFGKNRRIRYVSPSQLTNDTKNIEKVVFTETASCLNFKKYCEHIANQLTDYDVVLMGKDRIEISGKNSNKRDALLKVLEWNNLHDNQIIVFGDEGNDVKMLNHFSNSFAMGNADEHVKKVAKHTADTNENNGVLKSLKNILNRGIEHDHESTC